MKYEFTFDKKRSRNKAKCLILFWSNFLTLLFISFSAFLRYIYKNLNSLRELFFTFSLFCLSLNTTAQRLSLVISGNSDFESKIIDSLSYTQKHVNAKSILNEVNLMSEKLTKIGYIDNNVVQSTKVNDSTFNYLFNLKNKVDFIHIYIGRGKTFDSVSNFVSKNDTVIIPYLETENFLQQIVKELEKKGFPLAKLKLDNLKKANKNIIADLKIKFETQRQIDDIVILGYDNFPKGHKNSLKRIYKNKTFNQDNLKKVYDDFEKFRFTKQLKYPEILFEKDSTKIYVYLEKTKSNNFDGFVGFSNNREANVMFNGYLDLDLNNTLNSGERFSLYWKSDGNQQKTLNLALEIPYLFKSPLGIKTQLNIFKQDSTFQNTKTAIDLGYFFNYNTRTYIGYQSTESSDIMNLNSISINDYKNSFITTHFEFIDFKTDNFLFPEKTKINLKIGLGNRKSLKNNDQSFFNIDILHNFYLNQKNNFYIKSQNYFLKSNSYLTNELYRFGGIKSIRGFGENSLQANLFTSLLTEYRYTISPSLYLHSIIDYGYFQDKTTLRSGSLTGIGFGFGLVTKNGLLNLIYANGSAEDFAFKGSNSIVHVSFKTNF